MFDLVDQAVHFVLSKINRSIGTRAESVQAPTTYEIPKEVVSEAVVNAVAHRDYTDGFVVTIRRPEFSQRVDGELKSQQESRPRSLEEKVLSLLTVGQPMSRLELSKGLGQKKISGQ